MDRELFLRDLVNAGAITEEQLADALSMLPKPKVRRLYCSWCNVQTHTSLEGQIRHIPCGRIMMEVDSISHKIPMTDKIAKARSFVEPEKEKSVKFEVGDKVSMTGVVVAAGRQLNIDMGEHTRSGSGYIFDADPNYVILVERPDKFKKGIIYRNKRMVSDWKYMYLGDDKFYSYKTGEVHRSNALMVEDLVPVED